MDVRKRRLPISLVGVFALLVGPAAAPGQTIVVTAKSVNDLVEDLEYLIKAVAPEGDPNAQNALGALEQFRAGDLVKGLDRGRGFGVAVSLPKDFPQGGPPSVVAAVPVSDLGQFLDSLKGFGLAVDDKPGVAGFSHKVTGPDGNTNVFVLESRGYALFSLVPEGADRLRALDLASWRPSGRTESALSARIRLSEIPDALKDQMLAQAEAQAKQQGDRKRGEKEADYRGRVAAQDLSLEGLKRLVREGDSMELDLDVSRRAAAMSLGLALTARPGTEMAKMLRSFGEQRSRFEGLGRDAAVAGWARFPIAEAFREILKNSVDDGIKDGQKDLKTEQEKALLRRLGELVKANLTAPEFDLGLALQPAPSAGQDHPRFIMVGGMRVQDGREFERLARDAAGALKPDDDVKVAFDVAKAADGTAIHRVTGPLDKDDKKHAEVIQNFGAQAALFFACRPDAVFATFGEDGLAALRRTLGGPSPAPAATTDGPIALVAHMGPLGTMADKKAEDVLRASAEIFKGDAAGRDRVVLGLRVEGDGIRLRLSMDVPALKLLVILGHEEKVK